MDKSKEIFKNEISLDEKVVELSSVLDYICSEKESIVVGSSLAAVLITFSMRVGNTKENFMQAMDVGWDHCKKIYDSKK